MSAKPSMADGTPWFRSLSPSAKAHVLVFLGAFCISFAALFVQGATMDPSMIAFYRLAFGGGALFLVAVMRGERIVPTKGVLAVMIPAGLFFSGDLLAWHESIVRLGPGLATIVSNFQVLLMAAYGIFFLGEKLSCRHIFAMPLAILGLGMLIEVNPLRLPPQTLAGLGYGLATALFYTGYLLTVRQSQVRTDHLPPIANMAWISWLACAGVAVFCLMRGIPFGIPDVRTGAILAALGILCQATGWVLLSLGLPLLPPSRAGLILLAQPALSFVWDIVLCGRETGIIGYLGAVTAIFAIWLGLGAPGRKK